MAQLGVIHVQLLTIVSVSSFQVMFDSVNFFNSSGLMELNARVRKINRTTAALSGNFVQNVDMDTNFNVSLISYTSLKNNISKTILLIIIPGFDRAAPQPIGQQPVQSLPDETWAHKFVRIPGYSLVRLLQVHCNIHSERSEAGRVPNDSQDISHQRLDHGRGNVSTVRPNRAVENDLDGLGQQYRP